MPKTRFTTIDLRASISELGSRMLGLRVGNVYDINNKTYLIKLGGADQKEMILLESGNRIHSTLFEWPKSMMPSGFSMKLRKHLRGRRLVGIKQLGMDRVIDLQFGSDEAAYHLIIELYDRGNIMLTDHEFVILNLLRTRKEGDDVRFAVRETFPLEMAKKPEPLPDIEKLRELLLSAKQGDFIRKCLNPHLVFGPALIDHCLLSQGFLPDNMKIGQSFDINQDLPTVMAALREAENYMEQSAQNKCKGYIIQKREKKPTATEDDRDSELLTYAEYHPFLYKQHESSPFVEFDSFNQAVDEFYSKMESQKLDIKALQQEKGAMKKLSNVKKDHEKRLESLQKTQEVDKKKAELIEINLELVDQAIRVVRSAIANQIDWKEIHNIIREAQKQGDPVASTIRDLKLESNHITLVLTDPYTDHDEGVEEEEKENAKAKKKTKEQPITIDIDLGLSAYANARKHYDHKKHSKMKEDRTIQSSEKAIKSAERKTKQALKDVATITSINRSRKTYWFEKFFWCISSENYVIIAGRDQQQNEMVVKKYLTQGDVYVHADLHGASSVIIKNPSGDPIPPKTLNEAGTMAVCYSVAWEAKVITSAWWVNHYQVSKTAPAGEYLPTGSFMIRGKKNYLPPSQLIMGFGFQFKVDETCAWRHKDERKVKKADDEEVSIASSSTVDSVDEELLLQADSDSEETMQSPDMDVIVEDLEGETRDAKDIVSNPNDIKNEKGEHDQGGDEAGEEGQSNTEITSKEEVDQAIEKSADESDEGISNPKGIKNDMREHDQGGNEAREEGESKAEILSKEEEDKTNEKSADESDEGESIFPDTTIQLQHIHGDKYEPQRSCGSRMLSNSSQHTADSENQPKETKVFLGDDQPFIFGQNKEHKPKLTAKERRDLKKKKQRQQNNEANGDEDLEEVTEMKEEIDGDGEETLQRLQIKEPRNTDEDDKEQEINKTKTKTATQEPVVLKRGQKHKQKKIKQKYKDQDEEERRLKMELLASAGVPKETKKGKKAKKQQYEQRQQLKQQHQQQQKKHQQSVKQKAAGVKEQRSDVKITVDDEKSNIVDGIDSQDIKEEGNTATLKPIVMKRVWMEKKRDDDEAGSDDDKEDEENQFMKESVSMLDTITGCPHTEDLLLFALPVCAPYSTMQNYKFKVKLTPGTGRRGKAAKTVLNMFQHAKDTSSREKDLFKSVKDNDLSRNLPGKVKVSAPNLQKARKK